MSIDGHPTPTLASHAFADGELATAPMSDEGFSPDWQSKEQEEEYAARFYRIVEDGQPDHLMTAMTDPRSAGLVGSLPQTTFLEALHRLSPAHFVEPFRDLHHPLHSWSILLDGLKRAEVHFDEFVANLLTVVGFRSAFQPLQRAEYTHMLDCARSMGNAPLAKQMWESMQRNGIAPDTTCYNHYMETLVWDHCYTGKEAYNLRVLPFTYRKRRAGPGNTRAIGWRGYGTGQYSVRSTVLHLFHDMKREGHLPDERTYINLLIGGARVGHNKGMRHVLKTVWNIDIDAMKAQKVPDNSKLPPLTPYDPWSALYPTEDLLFAIAHALGTNNDISGAIRAIQHVSSSYNIPISERVWLELLERAYVLCRARIEQDPEKISEHAVMANTLGRVSLELVQSIFDAMTSPPNNVTPTPQVWRMMINISVECGNLEDCKDMLRDAYMQLQETREKQYKARKVVLRSLIPDADQAQLLSRSLCHSDPKLFQSPHLADAIQNYEILRLQVYQQSYLLKRCCWKVLMVKQWNDTSDQVWELQERPKFMEEWKDFLPEAKTLHYDRQSTGSIEMEGRTTFLARHWNSNFNRIPVRRQACKDKLFVPVEKRRFTEQRVWYDLLKRYPVLKETCPPLNRLFRFEVPHSPELKEVIRKLRSTWVEYPEESPLSRKNRPSAGFYGRLAALGMLKTEERGIYYLTEGTWV